jgi:fructose-specific phosphotransferase system IIC component
MAREASQVIAAVAVGYGVAAALSVLLQARQMLARGGSCDVSAPFLGAYVGGYATWLLYGLSVRNVPIIVVDAVGLVCGAFTLVVALRLRGRLVSPARRPGLGPATRRFGTRRAGRPSR